MAEANRLRAELPPEVQEILFKHEEAGTTDNPAYQEAMMVFYQRHLCRLDPWPDCLNRTFEKLMKNPEVYNTMVGVERISCDRHAKRLGHLRIG